jgi:hypothetical protein
VRSIPLHQILLESKFFLVGIEGQALVDLCSLDILDKILLVLLGKLFLLSLELELVTSTIEAVCHRLDDDDSLDDDNQNLLAMHASVE